ncbi:YegP family protein [Bacteroides sp. 51]|uniref:YegP family protein n=1 Tax=Bacteroides sp. 51 TaxID=2302938 RepID=UPI00351B2849
MMAKFEITQRKNGEFQFNLKASNGEIILTSEGYTAKESCKNGIESVKKNSTNDDRFERKLSSNGKFFFNLKAINGQVIGTSEMYESESNRENGIASVKKNAPAAEVVDKTLK